MDKTEKRRNSKEKLMKKKDRIYNTRFIRSIGIGLRQKVV
jgi:hypothetical protein